MENLATEESSPLWFPFKGSVAGDSERPACQYLKHLHLDPTSNCWWGNTRVKRFNPVSFVLDVGLQGLREKGQGLLDQISNQASWAYGKDVTIENKENVDHIQGVMEDMQLRKQRQSLNVNVQFSMIAWYLEAKCSIFCIQNQVPYLLYAICIVGVGECDHYYMWLLWQLLSIHLMKRYLSPLTWL